MNKLQPTCIEYYTQLFPDLTTEDHEQMLQDWLDEEEMLIALVDAEKPTLDGD